MDNTILPKDITVDLDLPIEKRDHIASFSYYDGLHLIKQQPEETRLKQSTEFRDIRAGTHFIVSCGDVMFKVKDTDYPEIKRREI